MGRTLRFMLALSLVLAACGTAGGAADDGDEPTTSSTTVSTTTTLTVATTATTTVADPCADEPDTIDEGGLRLVPGCEYRTDRFAIPLSFSVTTDWWLVIPTRAPGVAHLGLDPESDGSAEAGLALLVRGDSADTATALAAVVATIDETAAAPATVSDTQPATVGDLEALTIEVTSGEEYGIDADRDECTVPTTVSWEPGDWGFGLIELPGRVYGIPACARSRVWAVDTGDEVVLIVSTARDQDRFDELMMAVEDVLANGVSFGNADG